MNLGFTKLAIAMMARPATLRRHNAGARVNGHWVLGAATDTAIKCVIQSATQEDLRVVPEGERTDGWVTIYATCELRTSSEDDASTADEIVTPEGEVYRVIKNGYRPEGGFWRAIGRKTDDRGRTL